MWFSRRRCAAVVDRGSLGGVPAVEVGIHGARSGPVSAAEP